MLSENKISAALSSPDKIDILNKTAEIKAKLPFLLNLTIDERKTLRKMGTKSVAYVQDCLRAAQTFPNLLPPSIKVDELAKDLALYNDLSDLLVSIKSLCEGIEDTIMISGSDAMIVSDNIYAYLKQGSKQDANIKAQIEQIGLRYTKTSKKASPKTN